MKQIKGRRKEFSVEMLHFKDELISSDLAKLVNKAFKKEINGDIKANEKNMERKKDKK